MDNPKRTILRKDTAAEFRTRASRVRLSQSTTVSCILKRCSLVGLYGKKQILNHCVCVCVCVCARARAGGGAPVSVKY
jgi:hypothetical protein